MTLIPKRFIPGLSRSDAGQTKSRLPKGRELTRPLRPTTSHPFSVQVLTVIAFSVVLVNSTDPLIGCPAAMRVWTSVTRTLMGAETASLAVAAEMKLMEAKVVRAKPVRTLAADLITSDYGKRSAAMICQVDAPNRREVVMALSAWIYIDPGPISSPADAAGQSERTAPAGRIWRRILEPACKALGTADLAATVASLLPRIQLLHTRMSLGDPGVSVPQHAAGKGGSSKLAIGDTRSRPWIEQVHCDSVTPGGKAGRCERGGSESLAPLVESPFVGGGPPGSTLADRGLRITQMCPTTAPKVITAPIAMNHVRRVKTTPIVPYR